MILVIFRDFSNFWKKKSFIMKNENFLVQKILMGYCPFCIVREEKKNIFVLQCRNFIARNRGESCGNCIARWVLGLETVLQYS